MIPNRVLIQYQKLSDKECVICSNAFLPRSGINKFCSVDCKTKHNQIVGSMSVENQYSRISGNWSAYLTRLLTKRRKKDGLDLVFLLELLEKQGYLCALSGVPLTCLLTKGTVYKTNASIDRLEPGLGYTKDNIQLVCRAVNGFRSDTSVKDFIWWCNKISENMGKKNAVHD